MTDRTQKSGELDLTGGEWTLIEASPGFAGSMYEPPEPPYPATIMTNVVCDDGKVREFELATLGDTYFLAEQEAED